MSSQKHPPLHLPSIIICESGFTFRNGVIGIHNFENRHLKVEEFSNFQKQYKLYIKNYFKSTIGITLLGSI